MKFVKTNDYRLEYISHGETETAREDCLARFVLYINSRSLLTSGHILGQMKAIRMVHMCVQDSRQYQGMAEFRPARH